MPYTRHFRILYPAVLGLAAALSVGAAASALAAEATVAVSPGSATGTVIGDACPTFSWGAVSGAESYEVVVYRVEDDEREAAEPVLQQTFAGSASSWTPALDRCLDRGGQYAWSVRAVSGDKASEWSAPSLFEVASGPSELEFEEAVAVVRSYLETGGSGVALPGEVGGAETQAGPTARVSAQPNQGETSAGSATGPSAPQPLTLSNVQLTVDGDVVATGGFGGDGSNLTNVVAEGLMCDGCVEPGNILAITSAQLQLGAVKAEELGLVVPVWVDITGTAPTLGSICAGLDTPPTLEFPNGARPIAVDCNNTQEPEQWGIDDGITLTCGAGARCVAKPAGKSNPADVPFTDLCDALGSAMDGIVYCLVSGPPTEKKVFVTSTYYNGDLGGLAGADAKCNARAAAAGLPGSFKAWLTDSACSPANPCRSFTQADVPYVRLDGVRIADNWADLTDGEIEQPLDIDEFGTIVPSAQGAFSVWTNTDPNGAMHQTDPKHCTDWTSDASAPMTGAVGVVGQTSSNWTFAHYSFCSFNKQLYCFEQ